MKLIHLLVYNKASFAQDIKPEEELRRFAPQLASWVLVCIS
jgi:hypothetical protein